MLQFLAATPNLPFTVALAVMLIIALLEGVTMVLGAGISGVLEAMLPEFDVDADAHGPEYQSHGPMTRLLGWLRVGQVPLLMLLVIFLTAFGLIGLSIQSLSQNMLNSMLPAWLASIPALLVSLPVVRLLAGLLNKIMPKDETEAVSDASFIGRVAVITLGTATPGNPAQAKLRDEHGHSHYLMVEPDVAGEEFKQSDAVIIVKKQGATFSAIKNTNDALRDK